MLERLWEDLKRAGGGVQRRIDETHPLALYADYDLPQKPGLVLVSPRRPPDYTSIQSIKIETRQRDDGKWSLRMMLETPVLEPVFAELCRDIVEYTRENVEPSAGPSAFLNRVDRWRRLLERGAAEFGAEAARGLIGELLFLKHIAFRDLSKGAALTAWTGPIGAPHDFLFPDGRRFEIKTIGVAADTTRINGLAQLDGFGETLSLIVIRMAKTGADNPNGVGVSGLAREIHWELEEDPGLQAEFQRLLRLTGWREGAEREPYVATVTQMEFHAVTEAFPALTRASVPDGVVEADYEIRLPQPTETEVLK